MKIENGNIMPQVGIARFLLGKEREEIVEILEDDYKFSVNEKNGWSFVEIENAKFYFNSDKVLQQIGVTIGFSGKLENCIGIGSTLSDLKKKYGEFYNEYDQYMIKGIEGVCFELGDTDDEEEWDELNAPIEWIFVYNDNYK